MSYQVTAWFSDPSMNWDPLPLKFFFLIIILRKEKIELEFN